MTKFLKYTLNEIERKVLLMRSYELSKETLETMVQIFGEGSSAGLALKEAENYPEGVRFFKSHGSIFTVPNNKQAIFGGKNE